MSDGLIIDQLKKNQILDLLKEGKRIDGRQFDEPRKLTIDIGVIPKAEGSARARLGDTEVVAGVKVQPERPFPDTGDKGMLISNNKRDTEVELSNINGTNSKAKLFGTKYGGFHLPENI
mgnify:CR=1 FL=1